MRLSQLFAAFGGLVLLSMIALSAASVLGRFLMDTPIQGDFELIQLGCAVCVAAFLPYCQMRGGHVVVDVFTLRAPLRMQHGLDAVGAVLLALCAALLAWRTAAGALAVRAVGETTMIVGVPMWWAYACMAPAFLLLTATGLYGAWRALQGPR
jgi:TRAP-type C4-dicarboxylate transport system permease small subunit